jgi:uncharacterized membrane protein YeaQ/YmgE (transglycosylase-associated protein family)
MLTFATFPVDLAGALSWLLMGLLVGLLAGHVGRRGEYGLLGEVYVAVVGALVGGALGALLARGWPGYVYSLCGAYLGACVLIAAGRGVGAGRTWR